MDCDKIKENKNRSKINKLSLSKEKKISRIDTVQLFHERVVEEREKKNRVKGRFRKKNKKMTLFF